MMRILNKAVIICLQDILFGVLVFMRKVQICIPHFNFDFWALLRLRKKTQLYEYIFKMLSSMNIPCRLDNFIFTAVISYLKANED